MGWENVLSCEFADFPASVLKYHFPSADHYGDIRQLDGTKYRGKIDILTGGFPCQPFSSAGKRRGTDDNRFLWPEMLRVIREIQPAWIVAENVRGITSIDNGMVFERVCSELEANGYEVQPFCIPACAVGAPHKRERIWFIANSRGIESRRLSDGEREKIPEAWGTSAPSSDSSSIQLQRGEFIGSGSGESKTETRNGNCNVADTSGEQNRRICLARFQPDTGTESWNEAAARLCRVDDGLPRELDGITVPRWRRESLKAYGNAIVPQIAYRIFQAIEQA